MPELPEVASFQQYVNATVLHKTIGRVDIHDDDLLDRISARQFRSRLQQRTFAATRRHGKYLFIELDNGEWLVMHFGMTGFLKDYKDKADAPPHARVVFAFTDGSNLAYDSQRKLGCLALIDDVDAFIAGQELGPDALDTSLTWDRFKERLSGRNGTIKATLMHQHILAGIGNVYGDEILFQARVHPATNVKDLDEKTLKKLHQVTRRVLEVAVRHQAKVEKLPRSYLLPCCHGDETCPRCSGTIEAIKVSGRTAYYCPRCQR